jgi:hypothetical protein
MRRRTNLHSSFRLTALRRNNGISILIPSGIGTCGKGFERLVPDNLDALHST